MPISDLLASISGGPGAPTTTSTILRTTSSPKRKAGDDLRQGDIKTPRVNPPTPARSNTNSKPLSRPDIDSRPKSTASAGRPTLSGSNGPSNQPGQPKATPKNAANVRPSTTHQNGLRRENSAPARPTAGQNGPSAATAVKAPPKKGSFAEILARGRQAHAQMGQVGVIQHKKVEKGAVFNKKREAETGPPARPKQTPGAYTGNARPSQKAGLGGRRRPGSSSSARPPPNGQMRNAKHPVQRPAGRPGAGPGPGKKAPQEPPKKVKKAATATTGYTGTSRPRPASSSSKGREQPRGGALLNQPKGYGASRSRSQEGDYDDDMDDFIDYDDEEDQGPRYEYASDGSSDMEAGLGDIDDEERRAEAIARREDIEEERLEKNLRMAKEERKKRALEELRTRRR